MLSDVWLPEAEFILWFCLLCLCLIYLFCTPFHYECVSEPLSQLGRQSGVVCLGDLGLSQSELSVMLLTLAGKKTSI